MNKKLLKATTAVTLAATALSPVTPYVCYADEEGQTLTLEEAKKALEEAKEKNRLALEAQQAALDALNTANADKEAAAKKVEEAVKKAEEARRTAEALLAETKKNKSDELHARHKEYEL